MLVRLQDLKRPGAAGRTLDVDHGRFAEADRDAEVGSQRGLDDFLLDFAVERDVDLVPLVVLPHVDQRILFGKLAESDTEALFVAGIGRDHYGFQRWRRELADVLVAGIGGGRTGGGNWLTSSWPGSAGPNRSPILAWVRPPKVPIWPTWTSGRLSADPRSKTAIEVTLSSRAASKLSRSRIRTVPA